MIWTSLGLVDRRFRVVLPGSPGSWADCSTDGLRLGKRRLFNAASPHGQQESSLDSSPIALAGNANPTRSAQTDFGVNLLHPTSLHSLPRCKRNGTMRES